MPKREKIKVPSTADYHDAVLELDMRYPDDESFLEVVRSETVALPRHYKQALGMIARFAVPLDKYREGRLDICRALAFGAGTASLVGNIAHDRFNLIHTIGPLEISKFSSNSMDKSLDFSIALHDRLETELPSAIGQETTEWLEQRGEMMSQIGIYQNTNRFWFMAGAAQTVEVLYNRAVDSNQY